MPELRDSLVGGSGRAFIAFGGLDLRDLRGFREVC